MFSLGNVSECSRLFLRTKAHCLQLPSIPLSPNCSKYHKLRACNKSPYRQQLFFKWKNPVVSACQNFYHSNYSFAVTKEESLEQVKRNNKDLISSFFKYCQKGRLSTYPKRDLRMTEPRALSLNDPTSFSNPEEIRAENINIRWDVDFEKKVLDGAIVYNLVASNADVKKLILDIRDLHIKYVKDAKGQALAYEIGEPYMTMGRPLNITLPPLTPDGTGSLKLDIEIAYETDPSTSALQWLAKEMTAERQFPFLYSHSEAIHARALFPCQDTPFTKSTYTAAVTAPKEAVVLFSAVAQGEPEPVGETKRLHKYFQKVPVPSYLVAFAVGKLESAEIGPRSRVWAEKSLIEDAAYDFAETEQMIQAAESIGGEYVWGRYDILVLPPSFPFGGMENPCLTFATPTLLTHDRSLANVIAHEIAHSWTGNLVTNKNFEHFWLNEGFTVFLERKIGGILKGELERQFASIEGWSTLQETVDTLGKDSPMTKLVLDLKGVDPDDSFSSIPYEKGYVFLYYLETKVGGAAAMNGFLRQYVQKYKYKSIDSFEFKKNFIEYFETQGKGDSIKDVDWDSWFYSAGMPSFKPEYDTTLYDACSSLSKRWLVWDHSTPNPFAKSDLDEFSATQIQEFLQSVLSAETALPEEKVRIMEEVYGFNAARNAEIRFRWLRVCIKARWKDQLPLALQFVTDVGRMKFIRPIYRDLYNWEEARAEAIATFKKNRPYMMYVSAYTVAKDLHLEE